MPNSDVQNIRGFFDECSLIRDEEFSSDPILGHEDNTRRNAISSLIADDYPIILDAGCGNGRDFGLLLSHTNRIVGIDFSLEMVKGAKSKIDRLTNERKAAVLTGDVTRLPFRDNSFDLITCSEVLEHVPNWLQAVVEFQRVLKPGGDLIISTPNKYSIYGLTRYTARLFIKSKHPYDDWKTYFELRDALVSRGFDVAAARGSCYLPGDISYYQPFKKVITHFLGFARFLERTLSCIRPFSLLGYHILVKARKT